ncbi:MAG TPA: cysteine desulfurase NifS, partial [Lachnospiraceae bacterium]|nr:cysteine desulfurase NifS [Lachnospiraceae bacterium]
EYLISGLKKEIPFCRLNGPEKDRLPGHVNVSFKTVPAEYILVTLDMHRICASAGSACAAGLPDPSHVLRAMGRTMEEAYEGIRYSLSWMNTKEEIDQVIACTAKAVARYRVGSRTARW